MAQLVWAAAGVLAVSLLGVRAQADGGPLASATEQDFAFSDGTSEPRPVPQRSDDEVPPAYQKKKASDTGERALLGVYLTLGFGLGGDDVVTVIHTDRSEATLSAGNALLFTAGAYVTPLRLGRHSLGMGLDAGVKYSSIGGNNADYSIDFTRHPIFLSAHYFFDFEGGVNLLVAAGPQWEVGNSIDASGAARGSVELENSLGWAAEVGLSLDSFRLAGDVTLRYTRIHYRAPGASESVSGNNLGVYLTFGFNALMRSVDMD